MRSEVDTRLIRTPRRETARAHGRFRDLVDEDQWKRLPSAVRRRFEREMAPGESVAFAGSVAETRMSASGRLWAQLARLVGAPLPLHPIERVPAAVIVSRHGEDHSQVWTRLYHARGALPQVICSTKRFDGPTGLEECVGGGVGMALVCRVEDRALVFLSTHYFWRCGKLRLRIPDCLTPGRISVTHREERAGRFSFTLSVVHPWFGEIIRQVAFFRDAS